MPTIARVNYHVHASHRQVYRIDADGIPGRIDSPAHALARVPVKDVRRGEARASFAEDGIGFAHLPTAVTSFDDGGRWRDAYDREITDFLSSRLDVRAVVVFDHTVRVDDPTAPRRPARNVHGDYSEAGARDRLVDVVGAQDADAWMRGRFGFVNVWRPIGGPVLRAPLGFVRPSSVRPEDWLLLDLDYPDRTGHIMGLAAHPDHEWIYRSRMTPDEVAYFTTYDSAGRSAVAHSAIDLVEDDGIDSIRRSVESRALVRYRDADRTTR